MLFLAQLRLSSVALKSITCFKQTVLSQTTQRLSSTGSRLQTFRSVKFIQKDNIPDGYQLIYRSPMRIYIAMAHQITTISALFVGGLAIYVAIYGIGSLHAPLFETGGLVSDKEDLKYYAIGFVLINLGMRHIVMRFPLRIYRSEKQYIAILDGQLPLTKRKLQFQQGEVTHVKPAANGFLPWRESWFRIKNHKLLLLIDYFKTPSELYSMLSPKQS